MRRYCFFIFPLLILLISGCGVSNTKTVTQPTSLSIQDNANSAQKTDQVTIPNTENAKSTIPQTQPQNNSPSNNSISTNNPVVKETTGSSSSGKSTPTQAPPKQTPAAAKNGVIKQNVVNRDGESFNQYRDNKFGFYFDYPANFYPDNSYTGDNGVLLRTADNDAKISITAYQMVTYIDSVNLEEVEKHPNSTTLTSESGGNWFTLTGYADGQNWIDEGKLNGQPLGNLYCILNITYSDKYKQLNNAGRFNFVWDSLSFGEK